MSEMAEEKYIEELGTTRAKTDVSFVIEAIDADSTKAIGTVGLHGINAKDHNATFGIAIGEKQYWGKGYGTEAAKLIINYGFDQLNLHRVNSVVIAFNDRSIRMHRRLGFKEEGRHREAIFKNGKFHDDIAYGMLGSDRTGT
jgi:RimJ/RimL family protein N-acetyltransferase